MRIGYYSADFHEHATAHLIAELFELHDRSRFEIVGLSFGPDRQDDMTRRLTAAFDHFIHVRDKSDRDVARLSREMEIDIAVDLKGFAQNQRPGIFAHRAAPIQVNYLGYPGTTGSPNMDYIVADRTLIPAESRVHYSERVVYLPHSYQANDRKRAIAAGEYSRAGLNLPQNGFVFCCFNNVYKITPDTFDSWMRVLKQVPSSALWLLAEGASVTHNLCREAEARGINPSRLIFAPRVPLSEHLARHRAADLFLDTWPCNAHTTASDALWAGLPVLTCMGNSFAARVSASLLRAVGLPELIATTPEAYERAAVDYALAPERLAEVRARLTSNRMTAPLFDTERLARHLEAAYVKMYERYVDGAAPAHIEIEARSDA